MSDKILRLPTIQAAKSKTNMSLVQIALAIQVIDYLITISKISSEDKFIITPKMRMHRFNAANIMTELTKAGYNSRFQTLEDEDANIVIVSFYIGW